MSLYFHSTDLLLLLLHTCGWRPCIEKNKQQKKKKQQQQQRRRRRRKEQKMSWAAAAAAAAVVAPHPPGDVELRDTTEEEAERGGRKQRESESERERERGEEGGRTDRMAAAQCRSSKCTADRKGFRRELDSWRHKLINCVGECRNYFTAESFKMTARLQRECYLFLLG